MQRYLKVFSFFAVVATTINIFHAGTSMTVGKTAISSLCSVDLKTSRMYQISFSVLPKLGFIKGAFFVFGKPSAIKEI